MTADLMARLREQAREQVRDNPDAWTNFVPVVLLRDAADEIERLRREVDVLRAESVTVSETAMRSEAESDALRAALIAILDEVERIRARIRRVARR